MRVGPDGPSSASASVSPPSPSAASAPVFGWREMLTRRGYVRVHLLTIAIGILLFTPQLLSPILTPTLWRDAVVGNVMAIGVPFIVGAFLFGIWRCGWRGSAPPAPYCCCGEGSPCFWLVLVCCGARAPSISNQFLSRAGGQLLQPGGAGRGSDRQYLERHAAQLWPWSSPCSSPLSRKSELSRTGEVKPIFGGGGSVLGATAASPWLTGGIAHRPVNSAVVALRSGSAWDHHEAPSMTCALRGVLLFGLRSGGAAPSWLQPLLRITSHGRHVLAGDPGGGAGLSLPRAAAATTIPRSA